MVKKVLSYKFLALVLYNATLSPLPSIYQLINTPQKELFWILIILLFIPDVLVLLIGRIRHILVDSLSGGDWYDLIFFYIAILFARGILILEWLPLFYGVEIPFSNFVVLLVGALMMGAAPILRSKTMFKKVTILLGLLVRPAFVVNLYNMFLSHPDGACFIRVRDLRMYWANNQLQEWTGYNHKELLDRPFVEFLSNDDVRITLSKFESMVSNGDVANGFQTRFITKSGEIITLQWRAFVVMDYFISTCKKV